LGRSNVTRIIDDHDAGRTPHGRSLGATVTVESWWALVRQAGELAAARAQPCYSESGNQRMGK
jgi:hypothetical protein